MTETETTIRPLTPKARRRSWNEPGVRLWWLSAGVLLVVAGWLLGEQMRVAHNGKYRLEHWRRVDNVKIEKIGRQLVKTFRATPEMAAEVSSTLNYVDDAGVSHKIEGYLAAQSRDVRPGDTISILVDPSQPEHWTDRLTPLPLIEEFMGPMLVMPLPVICGLIAAWQRFRLLRLWRAGILREGTVVGRKSSAAAPWSSILQCVLEGSRDKRIVTIAVPRSAGHFEAGSKISLIVPPGDSGRAIAEMLYQ